MGLLDQDSRKNLDNAEESMNAMWYHFSLYSNSLRGMLKSGSLLVKELGKMYDESDGLLGDSAIKDLKGLQKVDESTIIPLVDELDAVNASSKAKYDKLLKIFRLRMKRADLLKEEFEKMDENWKKAREKNKKGGEDKLKKKNEMLVEAERTYKEYNMKLIEDIIVFVEQKYDYLDPVIYCMLKVKFSLDSTMDTATKTKLLSDYEKKIESCDDYAIPFENSVNKKLSLSKVIYNPWGRKYFRKYLQREHSEENLEFWSEIEIFRQSDPKNKEALLEKAKKIYNKFLNAELNATVNISGKSLGNMREIFTSDSKMAKVDRHTFDGCQKEIFELMKSDSYDRFTKNEAYEHLLYRLRPKPSEESLLATLPGVDLSATSNTNSNYSMLGQDITSPVNIRRVGASASGSSLVNTNAASSPLGTSPLKRTVSWSQNLLKTSNSSLSTSSENLSISPPNNSPAASSSNTSADDSNPFDYGTASIPNPFENAGPVTPPKPAVEPRHILVRASDGSLSKIAVYPKAMDSQPSNTTTTSPNTSSTTLKTSTSTSSTSTNPNPNTSTTAPLSTSSSNLKASMNTPVIGEDTKKAVENSLKNIMEGSSAMKLGKAVESTTNTTTTTTPQTLDINMNNENNNNTTATTSENKQINRPTRPGTDPKATTTSENSKIRKAKVLFSFQAVDDNELSLTISDIIQIHEWTDPEWWLASKSGKLGYIPSNYVKFVEEEESWNFKVKALFDYVKRSERELSLREGDVLEVKDITPKDWWQGKNKSGESGYFPCNHVKLIQ